MIFGLPPNERREYLSVLLSKGKAAAQEWLDQKKGNRPVFATAKALTVEEMEALNECVARWPSWDNPTREQREQLRKCLLADDLD